MGLVVGEHIAQVVTPVKGIGCRPAGICRTQLVV